MIAAASGGDKVRALFCTAVWGYDYIDRFLNYSLRSQLSDGNLGAFDANSLYLIITDSRGAAQIVGSSAYETLSSKVSVECVVFDKLEKRKGSGKYLLATACQNYALSRSMDFDAIFFGYSDALWADGSYREAAAQLERGNDVIFSFGYPVVERPFTRVLDDFSYERPHDPLVLQPRTLAQQIYRHLHPMARANIWRDGPMPHCVSYVHWDVAEQGLLTHAFHMHPVAVRVLKHHPGFFRPFAGTLDENFVSRLYGAGPRVHVAASSDDLCVCSLGGAPNASYEMDPPRAMNVGDLANFAERAAGLMHRRLFGKPIRLIGGEPVPEQWAAAASAAAEVVEEVRERLAAPDSLLAMEAPSAYAARVSRRVRHNQLSVLSRVARSILNGMRKVGLVHRMKAMARPFMGAELELKLRNFLCRLGLLEPVYLVGPPRQGALSWILTWLRSLTSVMLGPRSRSLP